MSTSRITLTRITQTSGYLRFLQISWVLIAILSVLIYVVSLPYTMQVRGEFAVRTFAEVLGDFGMTPLGYAAYFTILESLYVVMSFVMGLLLFALRPREKVAMVTALALVAFSATIGPSTESLAQQAREWALPVAIVDAVGKIAMLMFLWQFPNGRYYPRRSAWLALLIVPLSIFFAYAESVVSIADAAVGLYIVISLLAASVGQVRRYRRISTPQERQQTKLVVFGFALGLLPVTLFVVGDFFVSPRLVDQPSLRLAYRLFVNLFMIYLPFSIFPISIGLAVLRYRLWNIDLLINRALVALFSGLGLLAISGLTTWLAGYLLPVPLALLLALLLAALLALPFNRAMRRIVDRNIYGFRFDLRDLRAVARTKPAVQESGQYTGQVIEGYELLGVIGRGGMGEVYKAYQQDAPLRAIKVMSPLVMNSADSQARFLREAQIGRLFDHPSLVRAWSHGTQDNLSYIIMDYIEGHDLSQHLQQAHKLNVEDALDIIRQAADALEVVHQMGIVHRDIKPSNLFLSLLPGEEIPRLVLMDFGVARLSGELSGAPLQDLAALNSEVTGSSAVGTIHYMAPEQIMESRTVDQRADIYALGTVLYEMLAGQRPFPGEVTQVLFDHLNKPAPDVRKLAPETPEAVAKAIIKALAKKPEERFPSAQAFREALA